jgi:hypothetical protein
MRVDACVDADCKLLAVDVCGSDVSVQSRAAAAGSGCVNVCRVQLLLAVHVCVQSAASAGCGWLCMQSVAAAGCCCLWMDVCVQSRAAAAGSGCVNVCRVQLLLAVHVCVQSAASAGCGWLCMQSVAAAGCCCLWMDVCVQSAAAAGCGCVCVQSSECNYCWLCMVVFKTVLCCVVPQRRSSI